MADSYFSMESKIASLYLHAVSSVHTVIYTYFKISPLKFQEKTIREINQSLFFCAIHNNTDEIDRIYK